MALLRWHPRVLLVGEITFLLGDRVAVVLVTLLAVAFSIAFVAGFGRGPKRLWPTVDAGKDIRLLAESLKGKINVSGLPVRCSPTPYSGSSATGFAYVLVVLDSESRRKVVAYTSGLPKGEFASKDLGNPWFAELGSLFVNGSTLAVASGDCRSA